MNGIVATTLATLPVKYTQLHLHMLILFGELIESLCFNLNNSLLLLLDKIYALALDFV